MSLGSKAKIAAPNTANGFPTNRLHKKYTGIIVSTESKVAITLCSSMYEIISSNLNNAKNGAKNTGHPLFAKEYPSGSLPKMLASLAYQK
ncbi:MAG: hypothetical protein QW177_08370 [Candidatus Nitrosotenuis sp.]